MTERKAYDILADFFVYRDERTGEGEALKITKANGGYYINFYSQVDRNGNPVSTCTAGAFNSCEEAVRACYKFRPTAKILEYLPFN